MSKKFRTEKDTLGEYPVPADAWYGIQTARAVENFPISGRRPDADFIVAHARIKRAAAAVATRPLDGCRCSPSLAWRISRHQPTNARCFAFGQFGVPA